MNSPPDASVAALWKQKRIRLAIPPDTIFAGRLPAFAPCIWRPGHAYVFFNYGAHFMLNVSAEPEGDAGGILIRAVEPLEGLELMKEHRGCTALLDLTRGPGRLASAFQINRAHDGIDLCGPGPLWLGEMVGGENIRQVKIGETVRIGITRAAEDVLRFYETGNPFVSGPKRLLSNTAVVNARSQAAGTGNTRNIPRKNPPAAEPKSE